MEKVGREEDGVIRYEGRLCVPSNEELKTEILREAHHSKYTIHPRVTKMFQDMKRVYWWPGMKRDLQKCFMYRC